MGYSVHANEQGVLTRRHGNAEKAQIISNNFRRISKSVLKTKKKNNKSSRKKKMWYFGIIPLICQRLAKMRKNPLAPS